MVKNTERLPLPPERTNSKPWVKREKPVEPVPDVQVPDGKDVDLGFDLEEGLVAGDEKNDFEKVFEKMLDPKNIRHVTDLNSDEITAFSVLGSLGKRYKLQVLNEFLLENAEWRVSKGRKGRLEVVKINQRIAMPESPRERRFFDFRR